MERLDLERLQLERLVVERLVMERVELERLIVERLVMEWVQLERLLLERILLELTADSAGLSWATASPPLWPMAVFRCNPPRGGHAGCARSAQVNDEPPSAGS